MWSSTSCGKFSTGMLQLKVTTYMTRIIEREFSSVDIVGLTVTESL